MGHGAEAMSDEDVKRLTAEVMSEDRKVLEMLKDEVSTTEVRHKNAAAGGHPAGGA